jgi:hypothetical protein
MTTAAAGGVVTGTGVVGVADTTVGAGTGVAGGATATGVVGVTTGVTFDFAVP